MQNFKNMMLGLNTTQLIEAAKLIMAKFKEQLAIDSKMYESNNTKSVIDTLYKLIDTTNPFLEALIRIEAASPYSIFTYILDKDFSDIIIYEDGIQLSTNNDVIRVDIEPQIKELYLIFMYHFVDNVMFISNQKFDTGNPIMDAEVGIFRFNIIHQTLSNNGRHVIIIRKQTVSKGFVLGDGYLDSIGISEKQKQIIQKQSLRGCTIVFGETGSGKTTLLKYMGNYGLDDKRNLIIIEDTSELNIPVPISLVTNAHKNIKQLFTASLRQAPSHMIVGETRTDEIVDILEACLTTNILTTIHANSLEKAIQRIIFMSAEREISSSDMKDLINAAIGCFIFMENRKVAGMWIHKEGHHDNVFDAYEKVK